MPSPQGDGGQDQLADGMPRAAERVARAGESNADADAAVGRDDLEDDVEGGVDHRVVFVIGRLGDGDEENRDGDQPDVVAQLGADLLAYEVTARELAGACCWVVGTPKEVLPDHAHEQAGGAGCGGGLFGGLVVGIDAQ